MSNAYRAVVQSGGGAAVGDATAADVLTGKTFSGAVGSGVTGTMPNQGAVSGTATPSTPYTIPAGYHNGSGTVTASAGNIFDDAKVVEVSAQLSAHDTTTFNVQDGVYVYINMTTSLSVGTSLRNSGYTSALSVVEVSSGSATVTCSWSTSIRSVTGGVMTVENYMADPAYGILFKIG